MFRFLHRLRTPARKSRPRSTRLELESLEGRELPSAVPVSDLANHTNLFSIGADRQVYQQQYDQAGNLVRGTALTTPGAVKDISAVTLSNGSPLLFVRGLDKQVWVQRFDTAGRSLGGYALVSPGQVNHVEAVVTRSGVPLLYVTGLDDQVYELRFDVNGAPVTGWLPTEPGAVLSYTVSGQSSFGINGGGPVLFVIGMDHQVYQQIYDGNGTLVRGYTPTAPGQVKDISFSFTTNAFFAIGMDGQVYRQKFDLNGLSTGGYALTTPGAVKAISQAVYFTPFNIRPGGFYATELFVIGLDDQVYTQKFTQLGESFHSYQPTIPGAINGFVTGNLPVTTNPFLFVQGKDNQIYQQPFDVFGNNAGPWIATKSGAVIW